MKIYEFNWAMVKDWVLAPNIKEAKEFYMSYLGCDNLDECEVSSLPKDEWSECNLLDINDIAPEEGDDGYDDYDEEDYCGGYRIIETFADFAAREKNTCLVAKNEF